MINEDPRSHGVDGMAIVPDAFLMEKKKEKRHGRHELEENAKRRVGDRDFAEL